LRPHLLLLATFEAGHAPQGSQRSHYEDCARDRATRGSVSRRSRRIPQQSQGSPHTDISILPTGSYVWIVKNADVSTILNSVKIFQHYNECIRPDPCMTGPGKSFVGIVSASLTRPSWRIPSGSLGATRSLRNCRPGCGSTGHPRRSNASQTRTLAERDLVSLDLTSSGPPRGTHQPVGLQRAQPQPGEERRRGVRAPGQQDCCYSYSVASPSTSLPFRPASIARRHHWSSRPAGLSTDFPVGTPTPTRPEGRASTSGYARKGCVMY
jgi:hypothetical protein